MNEILVYGDIGESMWGDSVTASDVKSSLDSMDGDVTVRINSPGGSVFDGFAIYNLLRAHSGSVTVYIDGLAASAASVIAMAGDEIVMGDAAMMMIHDPWTMAVGGTEDFLKTAETLEKIKDSIVIAYSGKAKGVDSAAISQMMTEETWMTSAEALDLGFATRVHDHDAQIANLQRPWINKSPDPEKISDRPQAQTAWRVALQRRELALKTK